MAKKYEYMHTEETSWTAVGMECKSRARLGWRVVTVVQIITPTSGTAPSGDGFGILFEKEVE